MSKKRNNNLLLIGDLAIDEFLLVEPASGGTDSDKWSNYPRWKKWSQQGGVKMLSDYLSSLNIEHSTILPDDSTGFVTALSRIKCLDSDGKFTDNSELIKRPSYRVEKFDGYCLASDNLPSTNPERIKKTKSSFRLFAFSDAGSFLREDVSSWNWLFDEIDTPELIYLKRHLPLKDNDSLWKKITSIENCCSILLVSADDLRAEGVRLARGLSWEAVVEDITNALAFPDSPLAYLASAIKHVIVLFDVEGAALISQSSEEEMYHVRIIVDSSLAEGDTENSTVGTSQGKMNFFSAKFLSILVESDAEDTDTVSNAIESTLPSLKSYAGLPLVSNENTPNQLTVDLSNVKNKGSYSVFDVPAKANSEEICFVGESELENYAKKVVTDGLSAIDDMPSAIFGDFVTVDRHEIDSFRAIDRLIRNYQSSPHIAKPISISVFGAPGSGKSFGVKQLVDSDETPTKTFNLSEANVDDLPGFFHEIRTEALKGKTPLCFFDEFDAHNCHLVSSFLAPMQDGEFREGARVHPTGRGIFVFAGGTSFTFDSFYKKAKKDHKKATGKKLMDFISRLTGYIDIKGPNPAIDDADGDPYFVLRRAILLRSMVEKHLPSVINKVSEMAAIDEGIANAFLSIKKYKHGARSIDKIISMCAQGQQIDRLTTSDLPIATQLNLHVDADEFFNLVNKNGK